MNTHRLDSRDQLSYRQSARPKVNSRRDHHHSVVAPLRRFLTTQVGRPWSAIYSDICFASRYQSIGDRWLDNWTSKVSINVSLAEGVVSDSCGLPLGRNEFYVDPVSGTLQVTPQRPRSRRASPRQAPIETIAIDSLHKLAKVGEHWFVVTIAPVAPNLGPLNWPIDVVFGSFVRYDSEKSPRWYSDPSLTWGHNFYACHKRSASSAEIKRGLAAKASAESSR